MTFLEMIIIVIGIGAWSLTMYSWGHMDGRMEGYNNGRRAEYQKLMEARQWKLNR